MSVSLNKFVDINIKSHVKSIVERTRPTLVLYSEIVRTDGNNEAIVSEEFTNIEQVKAISQYYTSEATNTDTYKYLKIFFEHGGQKAKVYPNSVFANITYETLKSLPNEEILIGFVEYAYSSIKTLAKNVNANTQGINEKLLVARVNSKDEDTEEIKNLAVKYSQVVGAEMTIAAYLTQVDINKSNSIEDYAFTNELIMPEDITDSEYDSLMKSNYNVDIDFSGSVRNVGGNCKDGNDVINSYVRIILHQTLTNKLIDLLAQKIKLSTGLGKIYSTMSLELEKYRNAGYLIDNKYWSDDDWIEFVNGVNYTIIQKGDSISNGYFIKILPISSLSSEDITERKTPNIYVVIADQYGIRKIKIDGEIV